MPTVPSPRRIGIVAYPGVQSLDITGPLEVFSGANTLIEATGRSDAGYRVELLSATDEPLRTSSGLTLLPDGLSRAGFDGGSVLRFRPREGRAFCHVKTEQVPTGADRAWCAPGVGG